MVRPQFLLDINDELIVDNFAGGGGASTGIEQGLGRHVDHAFNHNLDALGMHRINHPQTIHHCEDVFAVDIPKVTGGRRVGYGHFSPDCTHFTKARGCKPRLKKIRGLAWVVLKWCVKARVRVFSLENVEEFQTWGPLLPNGQPDPEKEGRTFKAFIACLTTGIDRGHPDIPEIKEFLGEDFPMEELYRGLQYTIEWRELRACDIGVPTIRKRLFMIGRCDGQPIVWPEITHAKPNTTTYRKLKPWRPVSECIDWTLPCPSIFLNRTQAKHAKCRRPLADATLRRIAAGIDRYVLRAEELFLISLTHQGGNRIEPISEPARTLTGAHRGEKALVNVTVAAPFLAKHYGGVVGSNVRSPIGAITSIDHHSLVEATLAPFITEAANASMQRNFPANEPSRTICAQVKGGHFALVATNLVKLRGNAETHHLGQPATDPLHTISAGGQHHAVVSASLAAYYGSEADGQAITEPLRSITTKPRFGLATIEAIAHALTPEQLAGALRVANFLRSHGVKFEGEFATVGQYVIIDIGMRMLTPRELFRAQGFPDHYVIDRAWLIDPKTGEITEKLLSKEAQIRMCGNSVPPAFTAAITAANVPELSAYTTQERRRRSLPHPQLINSQTR